MNREENIIRLNTLLPALFYHKEATSCNVLLATMYGPDKYELAKESIKKKSDKAGADFYMLRAIRGAPEAIVADIMKDWPVEGVGPKDALTILKKNNRVIQHGGGKGKALVILNPMPFIVGDTIVGLDDNVKLKSKVIDSKSNDELRKEIEALKQKRLEDKKTIAQLKSDLISKSQHSWG